MYQRIVVPTDGSIGTAHVALQAIDLAEQYGATIHALHVIDGDFRSRLGELTDIGEELETHGRHAVERIEHMAQAHGVDVVTTLEEGDPTRMIVRYAEEVDADLIVMGTHGRSGVERRLIGSVAERVVRAASRPVMTVRLPDTEVTVERPEEASDIARDALSDEGVDVTVTSTDRQVNVWVVEAEGDGASFLVYVDPVTQRASVIRR